jgi:hypothetical protein
LMVCFPSTLKMEAALSSKSPVDIYQTTRYYIWGDSTLHRLSFPPQSWLTFRPRRWEQYVRPKRLWTSTRLHGIISQKIVFFISQKKVRI